LTAEHCLITEESGGSDWWAKKNLVLSRCRRMRALLPAARRGADVRRAALLFAQTPHVSGTGERYAFRKRQEFRQEFPRKSKGEEIEKRRNEETKKRVCRVACHIRRARILISP